MRRPDSYASLQPTHSTIVSIINPSYRCLPAASKHTALPHSHLPHQPNPHSGVRGILRAPSPRVLSLAAFGRRPPVYVAPLSLAGIRNPQQKAKNSLGANVFRSSSNNGPWDSGTDLWL